jgi:hypothetical protein
MKPRRRGAPRADAAPRRPFPSDALRAAGVFAWVVAAHLVWLAGDLLWNRPISPLFAGDALHFLEEARHLASGERAGGGLPFHPPLASWLLVPLWWALGTPERVFAASKVMMVLLNAGTWTAVYGLLRRRMPHAGVLCLLGPLAFDELLLSSAANSEAPYRLLLAALLALGARWPVLGGALHAAAALTRAEHLAAIAVVGVALAVARPELRRWLLATAIATAVGLAPWLLAARAELVDYNRRFAAELVEPLPVWVPVSFYGPLNFALAQREEGIHFSRQTLPPGRAGRAELDPTVPAHHELVVHGYRVGLAEIAARPGRFLRRSGEKLLYSLRALGAGWTWRDLPKPAQWVRQPVDLAAAPAPLWTALALGLAGLGAWSLRADRALVVTAGALVAYRLGVNVVFFPYLRGMMIAAPAFLVLFWSGLAPLARGATRRALVGVLVALALLHFSTGWRARRYLLSGERDAAGVILDDRPVVVKYAGAYGAR